MYIRQDCVEVFCQKNSRQNREINIKDWKKCVIKENIMMQMGVYDEGWRKGPWTPEEDKLLVEYVSHNGEGRWSSVSKCTGLKRSGKSSRLRWVNYLRPGLKKGQLTPQEEGIIIELHALWGNKWSTIARYLPGRTDNEIKNYWRTHFKKRKQENRVILTQKLQQQPQQEINDNQNVNKSTTDIERTINQEGELVHPSIENHQIVPTIYEDYDLWSDITPMDCYLWNGLWNWDDQKNENQANVGDYFQSEGYIF